MVNHHAKQYVTKTGATTNKAENFFGQLKRSLDGTHHHVTGKHLARYLAEYDYRYSSRKMDDTARMAKLIGSTSGACPMCRSDNGVSWTTMPKPKYDPDEQYKLDYDPEDVLRRLLDEGG
jgi:hypothetical protein